MTEYSKKNNKNVKKNTDNESIPNSDTLTTTFIDHVQDTSSGNASTTCVVYKFRSRPPYEGFVLILLIVLLTALLLWWLNGRFSSEST